MVAVVVRIHCVVVIDDVFGLVAYVHISVVIVIVVVAACVGFV